MRNARVAGQGDGVGQRRACRAHARLVCQTGAHLPHAAHRPCTPALRYTALRYGTRVRGAGRVGGALTCCVAACVAAGDQGGTSATALPTRACLRSGAGAQLEGGRRPAATTRRQGWLPARTSLCDSEAARGQRGAALAARPREPRVYRARPPVHRRKRAPSAPPARASPCPSLPVPACTFGRGTLALPRTLPHTE